MTVSTSVYKAGPYAGSGTTGPFTVTFRFLANSHLRVIKTSTTGSETTLNLGVDYSVTGAGGASGTVTLTSPLLTGEKLTIVRNVPLTQDTDYVFDDSFPAESHEQALDKLTMIAQQLAEEVDRAVKVLPSSTDDPDALIASIKTSEQNAAASAASAAASYDQFDDRYFGAKTSNPTLDNDGNALQVGAEYWNSVSNERRTWNGSAWVATNTVVPDASVTYNKLGPNVTPILTGRNKIINGKMEIAQRGTSFSGIGISTFPLDRYRYDGSPGVVDSIRSSDIPTNQFNNSLRFTVATAVPSGGGAYVFQIIEGFNARDLVGRAFTLSFWVRSSKTGVHCVSFRNEGFSLPGTGYRSYVAEYTINATNTWEYKTITVSGGLITDGVWYWDSGYGLGVNFVFSASGSMVAPSPNVWHNDTYYATSNQVNCLDAIGNIFAITGVQLEVGSVATPFEHRPFGAELALCQRYFCKTFDYGTAPAQNLGTNGSINFVSQAAQIWDAMWRFPVEMRVTPTTVTTFSTNAASANWSTNTDTPTASVSVIGAAGLSIRASTPGAAGRAYFIHATASAEL
jgi:hypothetical protein